MMIREKSVQKYVEGIGCRFVKESAWIDSKQEMQCSRTYNVTLRRVRVTIVDLEKQQVLYILSLCL
jgi:hypothetical protein